MANIYTFWKCLLLDHILAVSGHSRPCHWLHGLAVVKILCFVLFAAQRRMADTVHLPFCLYEPSVANSMIDMIFFETSHSAPSYFHLPMPQTQLNTLPVLQ